MFCLEKFWEMDTIVEVNGAFSPIQNHIKVFKLQWMIMSLNESVWDYKSDIPLLRSIWFSSSLDQHFSSLDM